MNNMLAELLEPVSLDEVCGVNLEDTSDLNNLEQLVKGKEETQFSEAEPPDWKNILNECKGLFKKSKDLWVTSYLLIALYATEGFKGLNGGFEFSLELLNKYWKSIYPLIDEDDEEPYGFRLNVFQSIFSIKGLLYNNIADSKFTNSKIFPNPTIREAIECIESKDEDKIKELHNSIKDSSEDKLKETIENIDSVLNHLDSLMKFLNEKIGQEENTIESHYFIVLLKTVSEYLTIGLKELENESQPVEEEDIAVELSDNGKIEDTRALKQGNSINNKSNVDLLNIKSRKDIKRIFNIICKWYQANEPSSPVPLLIKRAESLLDKNFIDIIQDITGGAMPPQVQLLFGNDFSLNTVNEEELYSEQYSNNDNSNSYDSLPDEGIETFPMDDIEDEDSTETF